MRKEYNKLVRDRVPEVIERNGQVPSVRKIVDESEFRDVLRRKVVEEANELATAESSAGVLGEVADMSEILDVIAEVYGFSHAEIKQAKEHKRKERGGFEKRIFLESVDE